jgi:hypothetical protein
MTKCSNENLLRVLQRVSDGARPRDIMAGIGHRNLLWLWLRRDDLYVSDWPEPGAPLMLFRDCYDEARTQCMLAWDLEVRNLARFGEDEEVAGQWVQDERIIAELGENPDPDICLALFGQRDHWKRDEFGDRIKLTVKRSLPATLRQHVLKSLLGDLYNPIDRRSVDTDVHIGGGVMVVGTDSIAELQRKLEASMSPEEAKKYWEQKLAELNNPNRVTRPQRPIPIGKLEHETNDDNYAKPTGGVLPGRAIKMV